MRHFRFVSVAIAVTCLLLLATFATFAPSAVLAAPPPRFAGMAPDLVAFIKNGYKPVLVPEGKMTPSSTGFPTQVSPPRPIAGCLQPPAHYDPLKLTAAQMRAYGIAPRTPGEPLSKWLKYEAHVGHHVCVTQSSNAVVGWGGVSSSVSSAGKLGPLASVQYTNDIWGGKVADQNCGSQGQGISCQDFTHNYIETDTDYYVHCPSYTPQITHTASVAAWAGLGGTAGYYELQQDGTQVSYVQDGGGTYSVGVHAWYEYFGNSGSEGEQPIAMTVLCGDHMFAKVYGGNCYDVIDLSDHNNTFNWCNGPVASTQSAELILERDGGSVGGVPVGVFYGADTTWYGAGLTDTDWSPDYIGYGTAQHDYMNAYLDGTLSGDLMISTGPIQNDPGDVPYDQWTESIVNPCGGYTSCY